MEKQPLIEKCDTCKGSGIKDKKECPDCYGKGVRKRYVFKDKR